MSATVWYRLFSRLSGRSPDRLQRAFLHPGQLLWRLTGVFAFRQPWSLVRCYLTRTNPANLTVQTRSGDTLRLTGDEDDVVTVLLVLGRRMYGDIPAGGVVLDVGAHLGAFTLYAMRRGAGRVYAFEPDPLLYETLRENVAANRLSDRVVSAAVAVVGRATDRVRFVREGNASGHVEGARTNPPPPSARDAVISVPGMTLRQILETHGIDRVDLLKLDCEGSEYEIARGEEADTWAKIQRVRLEYHSGRIDELTSRFHALGFTVVRHTTTSPFVGWVWFERG